MMNLESPNVVDAAPSVSELLDVDREFRKSGRMTLLTDREGRRYSVLYSPSELARRMGRSLDWVIIDLERAGPGHQWTVVTEWRGILRGKRVVRGREVESYAVYQQQGRIRPAGRMKVAG